MTSLHALEEAGGLDALYVEPGVSDRQQHVGNRHAGDDFGKPAACGTEEDGDATGGDRRAPLYDFMGRRCRAGA